jgi:hypothetical protein
MNKALAVAVFALLTTTPMPAQTPVRATPVSVNPGRPDSATNKELNIQAYIQLLRTDIKKAKSQIFGDVMQLDADESAKFWPVYKEFEAEYSSLGDQVVELVRKYVDNYDQMTDPLADQLANQVLSIERQRSELKKKYFDRMKDALGAITAMRFLQVENQIERLVDLQVAAQLPVVSEQ